jgi:hypothetical protein
MGHAVGGERLRHIEQIFLDVKQAEGSSDNSGAFVVEPIGKANARGDIVLAVRNVAGELERRVALARLRQNL